MLLSRRACSGLARTCISRTYLHIGATLGSGAAMRRSGQKPSLSQRGISDFFPTAGVKKAKTEGHPSKVRHRAVQQRAEASVRLRVLCSAQPRQVAQGAPPPACCRITRTLPIFLQTSAPACLEGDAAQPVPASSSPRPRPASPRTGAAGPAKLSPAQRLAQISSQAQQQQSQTYSQTARRQCPRQPSPAAVS